MVAESHQKWYSKNLSLDTEMLVYGDQGIPVILFPTSKGHYNQNSDFGLVGSCMPFIDAGLISVYCVDGVDDYSFYNYDIHPADRIRNHCWYDRMVLEEVVLPALEKNKVDRAIFGGCSFGGYHAVNIGFRYPHLTRNVISMGGSFDIRQFVFGHYDDNVYFNNPVDFMSNMHDGETLSHFHRMGIVLGTGENDICRSDNYRLSAILHQKGIPHWLDDRPGVGHDWPWWRDMMFQYLKVALEK